MSAINVGLSSVKTALSITKELRSIDTSLKDAEIKLKLADLVEALSEAKVSLSEVKIQNQDLKAEIRELQAQMDQKNEVEFRDGYYFRKDQSSGEDPGPFCSQCYSDNNKLIPMSELPKDEWDIGKYRCTKCEYIK